MSFGFPGVHLYEDPKSRRKCEQDQIKYLTSSIQRRVNQWVESHKEEFTPREALQADAFIKTRFLLKIGPPLSRYQIIRWSTLSDNPPEKLVGYQRLAYKILSEIDGVETSISARLPLLPFLPTRYTLQVRLLK